MFLRAGYVHAEDENFYWRNSWLLLSLSEQYLLLKKIRSRWRNKKTRLCSQFVRFFFWKIPLLPSFLWSASSPSEARRELWVEPSRFLKFPLVRCRHEARHQNMYYRSILFSSLCSQWGHSLLVLPGCPLAFANQRFGKGKGWQAAGQSGGGTPRGG